MPYNHYGNWYEPRRRRSAPRRRPRQRRTAHPLVPWLVVLIMGTLFVLTIPLIEDAMMAAVR